MEGFLAQLDHLSKEEEQLDQIIAEVDKDMLEMSSHEAYIRYAYVALNDIVEASGIKDNGRVINEEKCIHFDKEDFECL